MSGMIRMSFATELLDALIGPPAEEGTPRSKMEMAANVDINLREDDNWYTNLLTAIAKERNGSLEAIESKARDIMARCNSIRYVQLAIPKRFWSTTALRLNEYKIGSRNFEMRVPKPLI